MQSSSAPRCASAAVHDTNDRSLQVKELISACDVDGDGRISYDEFVPIMVRLLHGKGSHTVEGHGQVSPPHTPLPAT